MYLRMLQHEKYFRGKIHSSGKLVKAVFASRLTEEEDRFLEKQKIKLLAAMRERSNAERTSKSLKAVKKND